MRPFLGGTVASTPWEVSFDGGARDIGGVRVAGAGAVLWAQCDGLSGYRCAARATVALPAEEHAQVAEAWGGRVALDLLLRTQADLRLARVIGDNLGVIRYGAGEARLRRPAMQSVLEPLLGRIALAGWGLSWQAVRRRLNGAADALATDGVHWAASLARAGVTEPRLHIEWL